MKEEAVKKDAFAGIAEMEVRPHTMALKGEVQNSEEVTKIDEIRKSSKNNQYKRQG